MIYSTAINHTYTLSYTSSKFRLLVSFLTAIISLFVLVGWAFDIPSLKSGLPGLDTMNPMVALTFTLCAVALFLSGKKSHPFKRIVHVFGFVQGIALIIISIGLVKLAGDYLHWDKGIDQWLFPEKIYQPPYSFVSRMAKTTALNFVICGLSILLLNRSKKRYFKITQLLLFIVLLTSLFSVVDYMYRLHPLNYTGPYAPMAFITSCLFFVLSVGILYLNHGHGFLGILLSKNLGAFIGRNLLMVTVFLPFFLGWLSLEIQRRYQYDYQLSIAIIVVGMTLLFSIIIYFSTKRLNEIDKDRQQTNNQLIRQQKFLEAISAATLDFIYVFDLDANEYIYTNKDISSVLRYNGNFVNTKLSNTHIKDIFIEAQAEKYWSKLADNSVSVLEHTIAEKWLCNRAVVFSRNAQGQVTQVLGWIQDITEQKLAEEQLKVQNAELKKINTELDSFVYRASHDLRAPLSSVLGLIDISKAETNEEAKAGYFNMMVKSINRLDNFIHNIINYSRNARLEVSRKQINFQELISQVFSDVKYMEGAEQVEKKFQIHQQTPFYTDDFRLTIIFNNIVSNAIRYRKDSPGAFINVMIIADEKKAVIEFKDNGCGIVQESISKIFDMFYRASDKNVGSGLGLYIVKEAITNLKGTIHVDSESGKGTTFIVEIPNLV